MAPRLYGRGPGSRASRLAGNAGVYSSRRCSREPGKRRQARRAHADDVGIVLMIIVPSPRVRGEGQGEGRQWVSKLPPLTLTLSP